MRSSPPRGGRTPRPIERHRPARRIRIGAVGVIRIVRIQERRVPRGDGRRECSPPRVRGVDGAPVERDRRGIRDRHAHRDRTQGREVRVEEGGGRIARGDLGECDRPTGARGPRGADRQDVGPCQLGRNRRQQRRRPEQLSNHGSPLSRLGPGQGRTCRLEPVPIRPRSPKVDRPRGRYPSRPPSSHYSKPRHDAVRRRGDRSRRSGRIYCVGAVPVQEILRGESARPLGSPIVLR
jgi:hypothetical protein